ncbi:MAG: HNH endonuclease [Gemmataceae bacterium]
MAIQEEKPTPCGLCGRGFTRAGLTKHHCLPKSRGGTSEDVELICSQCHGMVHATFTNRTLEALYPTLTELRRAPELEAFIKWVRKQPPSKRTRNEPRRRKV